MANQEQGFFRKAHETIVTKAPKNLQYGSVGWGGASVLFGGDFIEVGLCAVIFLGSTGIIKMDQRVARRLAASKENKQ